MKKITPKKYLEKYYSDTGLCTKTVINWIKKGKINGEQTPTGRSLVLVNDSSSSKVNNMLKMLSTELL